MRILMLVLFLILSLATLIAAAHTTGTLMQVANAWVLCIAAWIITIMLVKETIERRN